MFQPANTLFIRKILLWNKNENFRDMPWKQEKNPYKIWVSEIILQQTRVEQGLKYYLNILEKYPDVMALAHAEDEEVFKLWEGLGYYRRCRNLLSTARYISQQLMGNFPDNYNSLLQLIGIGPYTAAAIASFAYNEKVAVLDGNVFRVLARYFGNSTPIDSNVGKKEFTSLAQSLVPDNAGEYNQAIMDLGANICKPAKPICTECPLQKECVAFASGTVHLLPVKEKKLIRRHRWFHYFLIMKDDKIYINNRSEKDIWQSLHEFFLIETGDKNFPETVPAWMKNLKATFTSAWFKQTLTHQEIHLIFYQVKMKKIPQEIATQMKEISTVSKLAFPKTLAHFIKEHPGIFAG